MGGDAPSPALLAGLRGHLLALRAHPPTLHTFNTTTVVRDGAQLESSSGLYEVAAALGLTLEGEGEALEVRGVKKGLKSVFCCVVGRAAAVCMRWRQLWG